MLNSVIVPLVKNKNGDLSDRNLIGLNKLSYLDSIMYMHLHKYLFKHTYYLYIKYRPHYNVHVYTCHNLIYFNVYMSEYCCPQRANLSDMQWCSRK